MKSLEHLIRDIREGKAEKGNTSSLEHAIRKIREGKRDDIDASAGKYGGFDKMNTESDLNYMGSGTGGEPKMHAEDGKKKKTDEAVGSIGTDDYQGNQFKSVRSSTPHIKPPAGPDSHSQAPENVSRQRTLAKEKGSMTMHNKVNEEEQIDEFVKEPEALVKVATPVVKTGAKTLLGKAAGAILGPEAIGAELLAPYVSSRYKQQHKGGMIPHPETPGVDAKTSFERMRGFKVEPPKPAETRPAPETKPVEPAPKTEPKPAEKPKAVPATTPAEIPSSSAETKPKLVVLPKIDVPGETKPEIATTPKTAPSETTPKSAETPTTPKDEKEKGFSFPGLSLPVATDSDRYLSNRHKVKTTRGIARAHMREESERKQIENVPRKGDRKSIAYVGRKEDDPKTAREKTSRQAAYKINVIDENKKLAGIVLSTVKDKKQQMKSKTEDGIGQTSKDIQYPNGTVVRINPEISRTTMDIDGKLPNDYK